MTRFSPILALTIFGLMGGTALAQDTTTTTPPPATGATPAEGDATGAVAPPQGSAAFPLGVEGDPNNTDGIGATYVAATHGDWEQRCVRTEDGADPCQLYQLLKDKDGNPVAEITMFGLPKGGQAAAGATVVVPLETLLTEALSLQIDSAKPKRYPFTWCAPVGCVARVGFTEAEVSAFRKGNAAKVTIVPLVAPDQKVDVTVSLKGFTAGYDAVNKANGN